MRPALRALASAGICLLLPVAAAADPFYSAGVSGVADANDSSRPCELPGEVSESYQTFPLDAFVAYAEGTATAFNPCSALSGSPQSHAVASLQAGRIEAYALAQIGQNLFTQEARASAHFSDDVLLVSGEPQLPNGLVGELRIDVDGTRSSSLLDASLSLEVTAPDGSELGTVDAEDLQGGESFVVAFDGPFHFFAFLSLVAADGEFGDFGATISVSMPSGYAATSTSGVLPTPEPGRSLAGAAAFAVLARRAQRARRLRRAASAANAASVPNHDDASGAA